MHELAIVRGAWQQPKIDRTARLCTCCGMGVVEDEAHLVFECPMYDAQRRKHHALFGAVGAHVGGEGGNVFVPLTDIDGMMRAFFSQDKQGRVAKFICECMAVRRAALAEAPAVITPVAPAVDVPILTMAGAQMIRDPT